MANRYIELKAEDAKLIDELINCIASHPHLKLSNKLKTKVNDITDEIGAKHTMYMLVDGDEKYMEQD